MSRPQALLVARRHVDLRRQAACLCRAACPCHRIR
ncbi:putative leader peptide [Actinomadura parmotrematis]